MLTGCEDMIAVSLTARDGQLCVLRARDTIKCYVMLCYTARQGSGGIAYTRGTCTELRADPYSFTGPRGRRIEKELVNGVTDVS